MRNILAGVDGSRTSWRAFSMAVSLGGRYGAVVHACFVVRVPALVQISPFTIAPTCVLEGSDGGQLGMAVDNELRWAGIGGDFNILQGEIAHELEQAADRFRADVIVVGRSRHPALHLGGVPHRLLGAGHWPVLVVP